MGLTDTFEEGKSITLGIDYKKEKINNINKYFEFKLHLFLEMDLKRKFQIQVQLKGGNLIVN